MEAGGGAGTFIEKLRSEVEEMNLLELSTNVPARGRP
jgi:hypothetical protein